MYHFFANRSAQIVISILLSAFISLPALVTAQDNSGNPTNDTSFFLANKKGLLGTIGRSISVYEPEVLLPKRDPIKNETPFTKYRGKIIRNIIITQLGLSGSVNDTINSSLNWISNLGDALHTQTRKKVIHLASLSSFLFTDLFSGLLFFFPAYLPTNL